MSDIEQKRTTILEIEQVANGYIVTPQDRYRDRARSSGDTHVFQTFAALAEFMGQKFTHREESVKVDGDEKPAHTEFHPV